MIKYALTCIHEHPFEGWFGSSADYEDQRARDMIECPYCASRDIRKQITAPAVVGTKARGQGAEPDPRLRPMMMEAMQRVRRHVVETFDYVGDRFAAEARAIHEGALEDRGIYGEASPTEVRDLIQDGVKVAPLPPEPPKKREMN